MLWNVDDPVGEDRPAGPVEIEVRKVTDPRETGLAIALKLLIDVSRTVWGEDAVGAENRTDVEVIEALLSGYRR
jgi:hypothetical protein